MTGKSDKMNFFCKAIQNHITSELKEKSPLRNEFETVPINGRNLLQIIPCKKQAYVFKENGEDIEELKAKSYRGRSVVTVPLFEISYNPELDADAVKGMSPNEYVKTFTKGSAILKLEKTIWKKIKKASRGGKGYLVVRQNPVVLEAHDPANNKIGYSIFEQIGVAVAH
jgi:hypothetical protein